MQTNLYNKTGKKVGTIDAPENIFGLPWNADLVHQVVTSMQSNARLGLAHTKGRGEVRGGGKKPWAQKGTGQARHGSRRSPIWKGGGVTHGPLAEKNYGKKINQVMRQKALLVILSRKMRDGEVVFVDSLEMPAPKASAAKEFLAALGKEGFMMRRSNAAMVALPAAHAPTMKSFQNFGNVVAEDVHNLNPVSVLGKKYLIVINPETAFDILGKKRAVKSLVKLGTK